MKIFCNQTIDFGSDERIWSACNGATRRHLILINKTTLTGRLREFEAQLGYLDKGKHSFIFINETRGTDDRVMGLFLNADYGYEVDMKYVVYENSSVGGYGNSESRFGIYRVGAEVCVHSYKHRQSPTFWRLTENGWEIIPIYETEEQEIV